MANEAGVAANRHTIRSDVVAKNGARRLAAKRVTPRRTPEILVQSRNRVGGLSFFSSSWCFIVRPLLIYKQKLTWGICRRYPLRHASQERSKPPACRPLWI